MKRVVGLAITPRPRNHCDQAVVELEVGLEVVAAQLGAAQHLGQALVALAARSRPSASSSATFES